MGMTSIAVFRSTAFSCLSQLQGNERGCARATPRNSSTRRASPCAAALGDPSLAAAAAGGIRQQLRPALANAGQSTWRHAQLGRLHHRDPASDQQGVPGSQRPAALVGQAMSHLAVCRKAAQAAMTSPTYSQLLLEFTAATVAWRKARSHR
jgi:hypothetical protein